MSLRATLLGSGLLVAFAGLLMAGLTLAQESELPYRAVVPMVSRETEPSSPPLNPPPPGDGYCAPAPGSGVPSPPNSVLGFITVGGVPAPVGTLVTLTFDGLPGPSAYVKEAGGYRVDYAAGGQGHEPPCINQVGSEMGILVNGETFVGSGVKVGDAAANPFLRFDVAVP